MIVYFIFQEATESTRHQVWAIVHRTGKPHEIGDPPKFQDISMFTAITIPHFLSSGNQTWFDGNSMENHL